MKRKQLPPLKSVQVGVQIRLTFGQIFKAANTHATNINELPMMIKFLILSLDKLLLFNSLPAIKPNIIVPKVGIKLNVA